MFSFSNFLGYAATCRQLTSKFRYRLKYGKFTSQLDFDVRVITMPKKLDVVLGVSQKLC